MVRIFRGPENKSNEPRGSDRLAKFVCFGLIGLAGTSLFPTAGYAREQPPIVSEQVFQQARKKTDTVIPDAVVKAMIAMKAGAKTKQIAKECAHLETISPHIRKALENEDIAAAFVKDPKKISDALERVALWSRRGWNRSEVAEDKDMEYVFRALGGKKVGSLFAEYPIVFGTIAFGARMDSWLAYRELENETSAAAFLKHPHRIGALARAAKEETPNALRLLGDPKIAAIFEQYPEEFVGIFKQSPKEQDEIINYIKTNPANLTGFIVRTISQYDYVAIELGRLVDDREGTAQRQKKVDELKDEQVLGLLCSNPELFNMATNQLLFERLVKMSGGIGGPAQIKQKYGLDDRQIGNLVFRALNQRKLSFLISPENRERDIEKIKEIVIGNPAGATGIYSQRYDEQYFYVMANGIENAVITLPGLSEAMEKRKRDLLYTSRNIEEDKIYAALVYLTADSAGQVQGQTKFDKEYYRGPDGKVTVVQIFDMVDTRGFHWDYSVNLFKQRYGQPKTNKPGMVVYENNDSRMILFMGETSEANQIFARGWITENDRGIVVFRGDAVHLNQNMPSDIFGNRKGRYVYVIGSCGSASSAPGYVLASPDTDLRTISYISTGRGVVTNTVVAALLDQRTPIGFGEFFQQHAPQIKAAGGDAELFRIWTPGEGLIRQVRKTVGLAQGDFNRFNAIVEKVR